MMKLFMLFAGIGLGFTFNTGKALADLPPPVFYVDMSANISAASMWGNGWSPNVTVDIEIGKEPEEVLFSTSAESDENGDWWIFDHEYEVAAGDFITVTDGSTTISDYTVTTLTVTEVNFENNTVSGTSAAHSDVLVNVYDAGVGRHVWADENGDWTADFDNPVEDGVGWDGTADLGAESQGAATQYSDDWPDQPHGATHVGFGEHFHHDDGHTPHFLVFPEYNSIDGYLWWDVSPWLPNALINITIGNPADPDHSLDVWSDDGGLWMLWDINYDIQPGDLITVDDGETTVAHEVRFLSVDHIDIDADIVSGSADPDSWVGVSIHDSGVFRSVQADDEGYWEANFSAANGDQAHDIQPGDHGWVIQDHDGWNPHGTPMEFPFGSTTIEWFIPLPRFDVNTLNNIIWGNQWPAGEQVTISIGYDLENPDFTDTITVGGNGHWVLEDIGFNILAGMHVRVAGGGIAKDHEVLTLGAPLADSELNTVRGTATPHVWVTVHIFGDGITRHVQANEHGDWIACFAEPVGPDPWDDRWNIVEGTEGEARVIDNEGNATTVNWRHTESPIEIVIVWLEVDFAPDGNLCIFECWIEGPGIMGARVKTPEKDWADLITEDWFAQDWEYIAEESSYEDLATEFPTGEYQVEITTIDGATITTVLVDTDLDPIQA